MFNADSTSTSTAFNDSQETKLTVAQLLSSLANGNPVTTQYSSGVLTPTSLSSGIPSTLSSGTTPLLTPSTLNTIEQFLEVHNEPSNNITADLTTESGFVPPLIDPVSSSGMVKQEYSDMDYTGIKEDPDWMPSSKRSRMGVSGGEMMSNHLPSYSIPAVTPNSTVTASGTRRPTGPRPRKTPQNLAPEEEERRMVRRERNKQAAAKCRQRRVDLTNKLINESEGLEDEQAKLEEEIQSLQAQKEQLEFLLEAHKPLCSKKSQTGGQDTLKVESSHPFSRPTSLPLRSTTVTTRPPPTTVAESIGIPITTPSSGCAVFNFGLEAMMDGHTGLTPITGAPSCASEVQRSMSDSSSSPSEGLSSPTTLMAL